MEQVESCEKVAALYYQKIYNIVYLIYMNRWMGMFGIGLASEKKMRSEAAELVGDNLCAEKAPFSFSHQDGGEYIKDAAFAYIPHLWEKIQDLMNQNSDDQRGYAP